MDAPGVNNISLHPTPETAMPRKPFILLILLLLVAACTGDQPQELSEDDLLAKAKEIHERVLTLDTHIDIPPNFATPEVDPGKWGEAQVDLPKMVEGGLNAGFWIVYVGQTERTLANYAQAKEQAMVKFNAIHRMTDRDSILEASGITGWADFRALSDEERTAIREKINALDEKWPSANVQDFVDHIDYAVKLIGIDHVGISSDFDGGAGIDGWEDASETFNVTLELVRRGYSEEEIAQLWSGNLLRVLRDAERVAKEMQAEVQQASS